MSRPHQLESLRGAAPNQRSGQRVLKRALDVTGATIGLVLLGPLLAAVAVLVRVIDGGPVLFVQERAGLDGVPFRIVKFRTMRIGADAERAELRARNEVAGGASFKLADDPRVTRSGRFLRRTSLDELPQLWNVLLGEMSLVGPRPHPFDDVAGYDDWHFRRLSVKPGLTGLWQVSARSDPDFDTWVRLDLEYIDSWSLGLDIRILAATIPALLRTDGR
jgi:lipopolysaccharide/colanic/teichoic acid biosynthesis glycosyltransferase